MAIQGFKDERARAILDGIHPGKGFPADLIRVAKRKLVMLREATCLKDLRFPPGNRLEALSGDRQGQHSIRVNDQFRLVFIWTDQGPADVEFVDYHCASPALTTEEDDAMTFNIADASDPLAPVHPGEILLEEFMKPYGLTAGKVAARLNIARPRIEKLVRGQTPITTDTALRLERLFGSSAQFWLNLQSSYDLEMAQRGLAPDIASIEPFAA